MEDIREKLREEGYKMEVPNVNDIWITQLYTKGNKKFRVTSMVSKYDSELEYQEVEEIE